MGTTRRLGQSEFFTLTKLAASSSETSRHQQVGRGLRLCVNTQDKRITHNFLDCNDEFFYKINYLDIAISNQEKQFIEKLQKEINDSSFEVKFINNEILKNLGLNDK